jgi:molybdopterin molybdotransferase
MQSLDEARRRVAGAIGPLATVVVPVTEALGLRTAAEIRADVDLPPGPVSAMDGYAVRSGEIDPDRPLPIVLEVPAGTRPGHLPPESAARIFTGAVLPAGADCVVPQERAERAEESGRVSVRLPPTVPGACVRRQGEVFARGDLLVARGTRLDPLHVALAAAGAPGPLCVHPRPRLAILTTGSELVAPGASPGAAKIRDSNTPMLAALARDAGLPVSHAASAPDELSSLRRALERAFDASEVVVTSGGVSVGDYDLVPRALAELSGTTLVHGVSMRPGKPILVARVGDRFLVGLPGNPVSALVGWRLFARPLAEALAGDARAFDEKLLTARTDAPVENPGARVLCLPARRRSTSPDAVLEPLSWKGSHDVRGIAGANVLARVEPGRALPAGARIECYALPWRELEGEESDA